MGPKTNVSMFKHGPLGPMKKTKRKKSKQQLLIEKYEASFNTASGSSSGASTPSRQELKRKNPFSRLTILQAHADA